MSQEYQTELLGSIVNGPDGTVMEVCRERYLPVPLNCVPPHFLNGIKIYISTPPGFSLYNSDNKPISEKDYTRLLDAGIKYVYISAQDQKAYFEAIENSINDIIESKEILIERKSEILYSSTIALAEQLCQDDISGESIEKSQDICSATVSLIMNDPRAFRYLYDVTAHDFLTATHMSNVSTLLIGFACHVGIKDPGLLSDIGTGGLLHDIGKIFISNDILNNEEELSERQREYFNRHVEQGVCYLEKNACISPEAMNVIVQHHERMDGTGYPQGLKGKEISITGRMAAVADVFDAMTAARPYRKEVISIEDALERLKAMAPHQLDCKVVEAFESFIQFSLLGQNSLTFSANNNYILNELNIKQPNEGNPSGRIFPRLYFRAHAILRAVNKDGEKWTLGPKNQVIVYNISQGGIGILSMTKFEDDKVMHITIKTPGNTPDIIYLASVVRNKEYGGGWYTIGMKFLKEINSESIEDIYKLLS
ncbi:MAG: HD domain-containing protein [Sedimentisphaerales bacterium]|nr:HD domain-containing protein [Sedimentisphaerales bacterium]MBN2841737.1 HD domain-containing protein [Sedimentisphaerales bacterium]